MTGYIQSDLFTDAPAPPVFLFFDTETTGLPKSWNAPTTDLANWPRMVQLAHMAYDAEGNLLSSVDTLIKPVGFTIPWDSAEIHGITTERAYKDGRDIVAVLREFKALLDGTRFLIAHNISFDEKIVGAEFLRAGIPNTLPGVMKICTMHSATEYCEIPGNRGYKWPKLAELHRKLFDADFKGAHNAISDVAATAKCFWELRRRGIIRI